MKIVDLQKLWNYVVDNFLIWNHLIMQNYVWISKIWNSNFSNDLKWENFLNENCRSRKVMKLCSWPLFDLNSFRTSNKQFTLGLKKQFKKYVIEKKKKKKTEKETEFTECLYSDTRQRRGLPSARFCTLGKPPLVYPHIRPHIATHAHTHPCRTRTQAHPSPAAAAAAPTPGRQNWSGL